MALCRERTAVERISVVDIADGLTDRKRLSFRDVDAGAFFVETLYGVRAVNAYFRIAKARKPGPGTAGTVRTADCHVAQHHIRAGGDGNLIVAAERARKDVAVRGHGGLGHGRQVDRGCKRRRGQTDRGNRHNTRK